MRSTAVLICGFLFSMGCRESQSAENHAEVKAVSAPVTPSPAPVAEAPAAPKAPLSPSLEEAAFRIDFEAPTAAKVGEAFPLTLKLSALGGYKVNQEYPIKFALEGANLSFEPAVLRKEQLTLAEKQADLKGKATATSAGELQIAGKLSFSVCTEERCLIEKRDVMVKVNAT